MSDVIASVKDLYKRYGETQVVSNLNFDILRGEFFGLLGPNGAGKTTTIGMLTGLIDPSTGQVVIGGYDLRKEPLRAKAVIGFVPQEFAFYPTLSARDNLYFFGRICGVHGRRLRRRAERVLEMVALGDCGGRAVSTFSNGMKRRLNIAIGLLHEPSVLILDEPTVGVDTHVRQGILDHLKKLNGEGLTVFYSTHHLEEAQRLCNRVAVMDKGGIIALDTPARLIDRLKGGIVRICFSDPIPPDQVGRMKQLGPLSLWDSRIAHILIEESGPEKVIRELIVAAERGGLSVKSLSLLEPTLETVFIHLTGRPSPAGEARVF